MLRFRRTLLLPRLRVLGLLAVVARRFVRRAFSGLPLVFFPFLKSGPLGAVGALAALANFRPPATRMTARLPLRKSAGLVPLVATPAILAQIAELFVRFVRLDLVLYSGETVTTAITLVAMAVLNQTSTLAN